MSDRLSELKDKLPEPHDEEPLPPLDEEEEEPAERSDEPAEEAWDEDYDEHIDGEDVPPPSPKKKKRKSKFVIVLLIILIILVVWTMFSPRMLPEVGDTYTTSPIYANLGNYTGTRDIWAGEMTWGVAISGPTTTTVGTTINISVLVTKVYERPGNWFLKGTAITLKNASFYDDNGTCVGAMSNWTREDIGQIATVPVKFDERGDHYLYAVIRFLVIEDMRIGFLPLETVEIPQAYLSVPIVVS